MLETDVGLLRLSVLGPVEVWLGDVPVDVRQPKLQALLAMVAMRDGRAVSIEELIDGIWGTDVPDSAVSAVRNFVWSVRRQLADNGGADILASVRGGYRLAVPICIDAEVAKRRRDAADASRAAGRLAEAEMEVLAGLELWRGGPLAGVPGPWAAAERTRLQRLRRSLQECSIEIATAVGEHDRAIAEIELLLGTDPHSERLSALLMTALHRAGRRAEALAAYQHARRQLVEDLGLEPGSTLVDLHQRILTDDAVSVTTASAAPRVRHVPAQLPPDITDFTGRSAEVAQLETDLDGVDAMAVAAVQGMGGVGKTTLAVHVAHRVRHRFPDGQLYVDLRGTGTDPARPDDVLAEFLHALGVAEDDVPSGMSSRSALWRSMVDGRRMLLLLDNAYDAAQVAPLLPGTSASAVLITSRRPIHVPGIRAQRLAALDASTAAALFARVVGRDRVAAEAKAARRIVGLCAGLPLAVRLVAARIASRPEWTLTTEAERVAARRAELATFAFAGVTLDSALRAGYAQLDPEAARAFRLMARVGLPDLSLAVIADALDRDRQVCERICEELVDHSMLESAARGRYHYHDLVRIFARGCQPRDGGPVS
ncbi:AfsR/SARP family transcriptional regulator [Nocardia anaemiae]|uniref:AfsR/SARP family transcriptional regulator n=1 Tax=Nocardia anaemiae TaxID=263910 RepID=UPI000B301A4E|nr:BTAD domain-containing putative transcriptional regulator [Nocardia anaemiae]